jgi:hypothetical protein
MGVFRFSDALGLAAGTDLLDLRQEARSLREAGMLAINGSHGFLFDVTGEKRMEPLQDVSEAHEARDIDLARRLAVAFLQPERDGVAAVKSQRRQMPRHFFVLHVRHGHQHLICVIVAGVASEREATQRLTALRAVIEGALARPLFGSLPPYGDQNVLTAAEKLIQLAEGRCGAREADVGSVAVKFIMFGGPHLRMSRVEDGSRRATLCVQQHCRSQPCRACFQIAHECVHALNPVRAHEVTNLEEGLAAVFSLACTELYFGARCDGWVTGSYRRCCECVLESLTRWPGWVERVRRRWTDLARLSVQSVIDECPAMSPELAGFLTARFTPWQKEN